MISNKKFPEPPELPPAAFACPFPPEAPKPPKFKNLIEF